MKKINIRKTVPAVALALSGCLGANFSHADWTYQFREHEYILFTGAAGATIWNHFADNGTVLSTGLDKATGGAVPKPLKKGGELLLVVVDKLGKYDEKYNIFPESDLPSLNFDTADIAQILRAKSVNPDAKTINVSGDPYVPEDPSLLIRVLAGTADVLKVGTEIAGDVADVGIALLSFMESFKDHIPVFKKINISTIAATLKSGVDLELLLADQSFETSMFYAHAINEIIYAQATVFNEMTELFHKDIPKIDRAKRMFDLLIKQQVLANDLARHKLNLKNNYTEGVNIDYGTPKKYIEAIEKSLAFADEILDEWLFDAVKIINTEILENFEYDEKVDDVLLAFWETEETRNISNHGEYEKLIYDYLYAAYQERRLEKNEQAARDSMRVDVARQIEVLAERAIGNRNRWRGGMIEAHQTGSAFSQAPGNISAVPSGDGKKLYFMTPNAQFEVNLARVGQFGEHTFEQGPIGFIDALHPDYSDFRYFYTNAARDFFQFEWRNRNYGMSGYYGELLNSAEKLFTTGVSSYLLNHKMLHPENRLTGIKYGMRLFVNWESGKVYGVETNTPTLYAAPSLGGDGKTGSESGGTTLYIGNIDRKTMTINGRHLFKPNTQDLVYANGLNGPLPLYFFGHARPNGIGGMFNLQLHDDKGRVRDGSVQMSGFLDKPFDDSRPLGQDEYWQGFASAFLVNRNSGEVQAAWNTGVNTIRMTVSAMTESAQTSIIVGRDGTGRIYGFSGDTKNGVYINKDAFVALADSKGNGVPSYVATAGDDGYDYLSWGVWNAEQAGAPEMAMANDAYWIAGTLTPTTDMPRSGGARYTGQVHGAVHEIHPGTSGTNPDGSAWSNPGRPDSISTLTGTSDLRATFAPSGGHISGFLQMQYANGGGHYATAKFDDLAISGNQFGGAMTGDISSGDVRGAFYGPGAAEVGGNWNLVKPNSQATGIFSGKQ